MVTGQRTCAVLPISRACHLKRTTLCENISSQTRWHLTLLGTQPAALLDMDEKEEIGGQKTTVRAAATSVK